MTNVKHSSASKEWYTPSWVIEKVHTVLGGIDFDPASCLEANWYIKAKNYYFADSLVKPWPGGSIFLNPPGGKIRSHSQAYLFWEKLMYHKNRPQFTHGIFLAFSLEALQSTQGKGEVPALGQFLLCIPKKRIRFEGQVGKMSPSHANAIVYIPGAIDESGKFHDEFSDVGTLLNYRY